VNGNAKYAATPVSAADISINGHRCPTPGDFATLLEGQRAKGRVHYEVEGFDVHVLNPDFRAGCPEHLLEPSFSSLATQQGGAPPTQPRGRGGAAVAERQVAQAAQKASLLLQVTGWVQYGSGKEAPRSSFEETFVLVPNWDAIGPKAPRGAKNWLIMSQSFRAFS